MLLKIILKENVEDSENVYRINYQGLLPLILDGLVSYLPQRFSDEGQVYISEDSDKEIFQELNIEGLFSNKTQNRKNTRKQEKIILNIYLLNRQKSIDCINVSIFSLIDLFPKELRKSKCLFSKDAKGKILVWQACIKTENGITKIYRKYGCIDGKLQENSRKVLINQSGRSISEQSTLELDSEINKKRLKGYTEDLNAVNDIIKPMLANIYDPDRVENWPVLVQAKLDGIRCFSMIDAEGNIILKTRENKEIFQEFKDIRAQLKLLFAYLPNVKFLDGELYYEDFFLLSGIVKRLDRHEKADVVKYYIFDFIEKDDDEKTKKSEESGGILQKQIEKNQTLLCKKNTRLVYEQRYKILHEAFSKFYSIDFKKSNTAQERKIRLLKCFSCSNDEEVKSYFNEFRKKGHEGAIIRNPNAVYKTTRCNDLMKLKEFQDKEFKIIDVVSGRGKDEGLAIFIVEDEEGNRISVRPKERTEQRREWFLNKEGILNKKCTVRYFKKREEEGTYIMPVAIAIRDYE
jgi:hypothetical protein